MVASPGVWGTFLPESILKRRKRGFAVNVVDGWFRSAIDSRMVAAPRPGLQDLSVSKPRHVRGLLEQHASGQQDNHKILFSLVLFEQWLEFRKTACWSRTEFPRRSLLICSSRRALQAAISQVSTARRSHFKLTSV